MQHFCITIFFGSFLNGDQQLSVHKIWKIQMSDRDNKTEQELSGCNLVNHEIVGVSARRNKSNVTLCLFSRSGMYS